MRGGDGRLFSALGIAALVTGVYVTGCNAKLPEPDSPGAKVYAARCNTCHRLYAPSVMKFEMWRVKVELMQGEMVRRGIPPLTAEERQVLLDYLRRHSEGGAAQGGMHHEG